MAGKFNPPPYIVAAMGSEYLILRWQGEINVYIPHASADSRVVASIIADALTERDGHNG